MFGEERRIVFDNLSEATARNNFLFSKTKD